MAQAYSERIGALRQCMGRAAGLFLQVYQAFFFQHMAEEQMLLWVCQGRADSFYPLSQLQQQKSLLRLRLMRNQIPARTGFQRAIRAYQWYLTSGDGPMPTHIISYRKRCFFFHLALLFPGYRRTREVSLRKCPHENFHNAVFDILPV